MTFSLTRRAFYRRGYYFARSVPYCFAKISIVCLMPVLLYQVCLKGVTLLYRDGVRLAAFYKLYHALVLIYPILALGLI